MTNDTNDTNDTKPAISRLVATFGLVGAILGIIGYFNTNYVSKPELALEKSLRIAQEEHMQIQFISLAEKIITSQNLIAREIRDAKAFGLIVTRDILQTRMELSPREQAELRIIQIKLAELNITSSPTDTR